MISEKQKKAILDEFISSLDAALEDNQDYKDVSEIKTAMDLYSNTKEGETQPSKILGKINEILISKLSEGFIKEFSETLEKKLDGLTITHDQNGTGFSYFLKGISASFELELVNNETNAVVATIIIGAYQDTGIVVNGIHKSNTGSYEIDKIEISINLYLFTKMILGTKEKKIASCKFDILNLTI